mmetsp:Transcript_45182/g.38087  ORF Transcript_45182/g.38087 Transcript_45182/m.38087 type:complete len:80 (-) Transcript_45182:369-608(-)
MWGVATAAHQIEGNNTNNQWNWWESKKDSICKHQSGDACNHWNIDVFKKDLALAKDLGINSYRLSIEWSRVEPKEGRID